MKIKSAEFIKSAIKPAHYPEPLVPEIAFAGRSNVGKSSLINTLVNRKRLVKTGSTPGRTQLLNFFLINEMFSFVDLPGYGYAKVPVAIRKKWGPMIETYLTSREVLHGVVVILDIRRTPGKEETDLMAWLVHYQIPFIIVLTKADKLSKTRQKNQSRAIAANLHISMQDLILFSAKNRQGLDAVWDGVLNMLNQN